RVLRRRHLTAWLQPPPYTIPSTVGIESDNLTDTVFLLLNAASARETFARDRPLEQIILQQPRPHRRMQCALGENHEQDARSHSPCRLSTRRNTSCLRIFQQRRRRISRAASVH